MAYITLIFDKSVKARQIFLHKILRKSDSIFSGW